MNIKVKNPIYMATPIVLATIVIIINTLAVKDTKTKKQKQQHINDVVITETVDEVVVDNVVIPAKLTAHDKKQITCLAKNIYHEARGESKKEQISVGFVTLNRVKDKRFPNTVCGVVHQPYQFSWTIMSDKYQEIKEHEVYNRIKLLAEKIYFHKKEDPTAGATHYFSHKVMKNPPKWAAKGENVIKMEAHTYMALNW